MNNFYFRSLEFVSNPKVQIIPQNFYIPNSFEMINKALLYLKPNANTPLCTSFIRDFLSGKGFQITEERFLKGDELMKIFEQQYVNIARKALILRPAENVLTLNVQEIFESKYGIRWFDAMEQGLIQNAQVACEVLGITPEQLNQLWIQSYYSNFMLQIADDCWISLIEKVISLNDGVSTSHLRGPTLFCINGFYPALKNQYYFISKNSGLWSCNLVWKDELMPWKVLVDEIIGSSDSKTARDSSLRNIIFHEWRDLGLECCPVMEDNSIHISQSAFEACAERSICFGYPLTSDPLGSKLFQTGLTQLMVKEWLNNSLVKGLPIFDHLKGFGCRDCLIKIRELVPTPFSGIILVIILSLLLKKFLLFFYCYFFIFSFC